VNFKIYNKKCIFSRLLQCAGSALVYSAIPVEEPMHENTFTVLCSRGNVKSVDDVERRLEHVCLIPVRL